MRTGLTKGELNAINEIALRADSMPATARKGIKNGTNHRSSLIQMLTNKNIIKPCFQMVASCSALKLKSGAQLAAKIPKICQQKYPLAQHAGYAGAGSGLLALRPETSRWHQPPIAASFLPVNTCESST